MSNVTYKKLCDDNLVNKIGPNCFIGYRLDIYQYIRIDNMNYIFVKYEVRDNKLIYQFSSNVVLELIKTKQNQIIYNLIFYNQCAKVMKKKYRKKYKKFFNGKIEIDHIYDLVKI